MAGRVAYLGGIVTQGLVLDLDAAKRDSYAGTGTAWNDISGNRNNGTLTNGPTFDSGNGGSIMFDGSNDRVVSTALQITNAITISFWMKTTTTANLNAIVCRDETGSARLWNVLYRGITLRYLTFVVWHTNGTSTELLSTANILDDGLWKHIVCTYDGTTSTNNYRIYINGALDKQSTPNNTGINTNLTTALTLGALTNGNGWFFNGSIAQVLIYNKYFSAAEVLQNYNATKGRFGL